MDKTGLLLNSNQIKKVKQIQWYAEYNNSGTSPQENVAQRTNNRARGYISAGRFLHIVLS